MLRARAPADQVRLERLVGDAMAASGAAAVTGSMLLRRSSVLTPFVVRVRPRHGAALVLIYRALGTGIVFDPHLVATLELTPAETQVRFWRLRWRF